MIIYKITNKINNKSYIGQSVNPFNIRYMGGNWWKHTKNKHLKNSVEKYGLQNFKVEFLHNDIDSIQELNKLEIFYIKFYNCLNPNGYNDTTGGSNILGLKHSDYSKDKIALTKSNKRIYKIKNYKTGEIVEFINISKFCKERGIKTIDGIACLFRQNTKKVLNEDWCLPETKIKKYHLVSPTHQKFIVFQMGLSKFCRENNLSRPNLLCALYKRRRYKSHKGWTGYVEIS